MTERQEAQIAHSAQRREVTGWLQLVVMIVAVASLFVQIGRKDQQLATMVESVQDLRAVTKDLLSSTTALALSHARTDIEVQAVKQRLDAIERRISTLDKVTLR
jgi:hypothetical protein